MLGQLLGMLRRPRAGPVALLLLHLAALGLFTRGFLLTRVHLPQRSAAPTEATGGSATPAAPYDRVVWLMIDALRYDFVVADGRYRCNNATGAVCHQGHMPYLSELARHPASRAFMFVADAPTTTTQRLKALATGGLPSFFDVSNSFSAGALADDNLVDQLAAAGHRPAFLGDTTWAQLFPSQWAWSRPYPCFNVRDLHTVDDGVWQHLLPALQQGSPAGAGKDGADAGSSTDVSSWSGLLVAHYLGVDHCGHTYGVSSNEMAAKLRQMDDHVRQVVAALVQLAGPGGPHERTLLLVAGDHGQTLGGDHGGGSPEEVDSVLVAVDISTLRDAQQAQQQANGSSSTGAAAALAAVASSGGSGLGAPAACRADCSCGVERNQCAPDLPQMDLTPTLAALLGLPIPFGNLGKLSAELWQLAAPHLPAAGAGAADGLRAAWEDSLAATLLANVQQVHTYLHTYAATPGAAFSHAALARLDELAAAAQAAAGSVADRVARSYAYLESAAHVAREQWTQFDDVSMVAGVALFAAALALHAAAAFGPSATGGSGRAGGPRQKRESSRSKEANGEPAGGSHAPAGWLVAVGQQVAAWQLAARWRTGSRVWVPTLRAWLAALALVHALGIFSFFYLLSEGRNVSILVGAACAGLALTAGRAARASGQPVKGVVAMGVASLRFNALMTVLGVAHHTGQGFWARLTVHDPQPADDVERGWHGKLAKLKALGTAGMAAAGLDRLPPAVLAALQHSLLCTLPVLALAALTERLQRGSSRGSLHRLLVLGACATAAAYLQLEDAAKCGFLPEQVSLQQLVQQHALPQLPAELAASAQHAGQAAQQLLASAWPAAVQQGAVLASLPLRELLPHTTYALCGTAAALWLAAVAVGRLRGAAATTAAAQLVLALLVQVSERGAPLILLLGLLQLAAMARLLARRAELLPRSGAAGVAGEAAALVALVAAQLFYATGHMCEFAGLQYTAGFVGSDEFHLWRSGALVALNTFGGLLLALLALPAIIEYVTAAGVSSSAATKQRGRGAKAAAAAGGGGAASVQRAVLVAGLVRAVPAFCAMLSAGVQRRHLYVWALFAPKFVFEACFLLLTDALLLLLAALA